MYKIALLTDFSQNSRNAIDSALYFYGNKETIFYLVHSHAHIEYSHEYLAGMTGQKSSKDIHHKESLTRLKKLEVSIRADFKSERHKFILHVTSGPLKEALPEIITTEDIDLIVIGTQGEKGVKTVFLGSGTTEVLRNATCPVLVIPKKCKFQTPKNSAFVTDFKRNFSADILLPLQLMVSMFKSSLRIMHINEEKRLDNIQQSNRNTLEAYLSDIGPSWHWMPLFYTKTASINLFIKELDIDFLIMVRYEHSFFERLLREPVIKKMSFNVDVPFLVIPFKD